jgi:ornithine cyclodeaminase
VIEASRGDLERVLGWDVLIARLRQAFTQQVVVPPRHHHRFGGDADDNILLVMPSWNEQYLGVKLVTVVPGNAARGRPALTSSYQLFSGVTGELLAILDGNELTRRRTCATAALAADYLAPADAGRLLVLGSGHIAAGLPQAFRAVRLIDRIGVWNIHPASAVRLVSRLADEGVECEVVTDLPTALADATMVSCATPAKKPVVQGNWLRSDVHLNLIGSFAPHMREADEAAIDDAQVYVDTPVALTEAGELVRMAQRHPGRSVDGTLADLCAGFRVPRGGGRTVFKAVGSGLADLAAAILAYEALAEERSARGDLPNPDHQDAVETAHEGVQQ